jgi:uncharacterized repeat protein (TIGR04138 family)
LGNFGEQALVFLPKCFLMQPLNFDDVLSKIVELDPRYHRDAYMFLRDSLEFTQKVISKANKNQVRHISGKELLNGIREYALLTYGPMTATVFAEWGIRSCEDFGNMVFLMVENNLLRKQEQDSPADFKNGYSFDEAFRKPFLPSLKKSVIPATAPQPSEVEKN